MPIPDDDIKSELSYAYLHGVAAQTGCGCQISERLSDNLAIDARITANGIFAPAPSLTVFDIYVQLKATTSPNYISNNRLLSFQLRKSQYDKMRSTTIGNQWILVLLVLPPAKEDWLKVSPTALSIKRCAYWVSLRGAAAPPDGPSDKLTIHVPKRNRFTVASLREILIRCSLEDWVTYEA